jgi:hypothetical protein
MEVLSQIILSCDLDFINLEQYDGLRKEIEDVSIQVNALRNAALKKASK